MPWTWEPTSNPAAVYTRSEDRNNLLELSVVLCVVLPFVILAGYLEGKLGGRLRSKIATDIAA